jgi:prophage regulatory protein
MEPQRRFGRLPEVRRIVPLSRSRIYELIAANRFPAPIKLSERASAWDMDAINKWVEARIAESREAA